MQNVTPLLALGFSRTVADRLNRKLVLRGNGCLEWTGALLEFGHGHMSRGARGAGYESTHRIAWMLENGPIPDGLEILHHCDNPPCCNVNHLFLGTQQDNMDDMRSKGRQSLPPRGEMHHSAKLTDVQVAALRSASAIVSNYAELGRMFGVSKQHARALVLGMKRRAA